MKEPIIFTLLDILKKIDFKQYDGETLNMILDYINKILMLVVGEKQRRER